MQLLSVEKEKSYQKFFKWKPHVINQFLHVLLRFQDQITWNMLIYNDIGFCLFVLIFCLYKFFETIIKNKVQGKHLINKLYKEKWYWQHSKFNHNCNKFYKIKNKMKYYWSIKRNNYELLSISILLDIDFNDRFLEQPKIICFFISYGISNLK